MQANIRVVFIMVQLQFFLTCNSSCRVGYFHRGKFCMLRDGVQRNVVYQNFPPPHPSPPQKRIIIVIIVTVTSAIQTTY